MNHTTNNRIRESYVQEIRDSVADLLDAIFDLACEDVRDFSEDVTRIENVRRQMHYWAARRPDVCASEGDVLFAFTSVVDSLSLHFGTPELRDAVNAQLAEAISDLERRRESQRQTASVHPLFSTSTYRASAHGF